MPEGTALYLELIEEGPATINVYYAEPRTSVADPEPDKTLIGTTTIAGDNGERHEIAIPLDVTALTGRKAVYLEFRSEAYEEQKPLEICQINRLRFAEE
jgi:hypothetical protein